MNFVDDPPVSRAHPPGVPAGELLRCRRPRVISEYRGGSRREVDSQSRVGTVRGPRGDSGIRLQAHHETKRSVDGAKLVEPQEPDPFTEATRINSTRLLGEHPPLTPIDLDLWSEGR